MKQKGKTWIDGNGKEVPAKVISRVLKSEEKHSQKILLSAQKAEKYLKDVVEKVFEAYNEIYEEKVKLAKIKGNKTNFNGMTINSFDGSVEIKITKPDSLYFDSTFTDLVKDKFNEYFDAISKNDDETVAFLRALVNDLLFSKGGKLDQGQVNKLRKQRNALIENNKAGGNNRLFIEAVELFDKSIKSKKGNTGIYVSVRNPKTQRMERIALKYSDI